MMFRKRHSEKAPKLRRGDLVEVLGQREILATLDSQAKLEGIPFMAEMSPFCGRRFRVARRADKVFLDHHFYVAGMNGTVLLEGVRCDGASHGGCQMRCLAFWKEAWLKKVDPAEATERADADEHTPNKRESLPVLRGEPCQTSSAESGRVCCQATELVTATSRLPCWNVGQYVRDLASRDMTIREFIGVLSLQVCNKLRRLCGRPRCGAVHGQSGNPPGDRLNLEPGEIVEVKSRAEIEATLDASGKTRGLGFASEMLDFCGRRFRVASRVERIILEWSGEMRPIADTVILEGVTCNGVSRRGCPRDCYQLWRESWLKRG
ncbi:MAG: hypothetical protein ABIK89_00770 [Planctomycetota bacterium]